MNFEKIKEKPVSETRQYTKFQVRQQYNPAIANIYIFVAALAVMGVLSFALHKPEYSEYEKRELAARPQFSLSAFFGGAFSTQADSYYADTFPFRDRFVALGSLIEEGRGFRLDDVRLHEVPSTPAPEPPSSEPAPVPGTDEEESSSSSSAAPSKPADDGATMEQNGSVFIYKGMGLSIFGGSNAMGKWYADTINQYAQALEGVQIYDLVIPTHIEFALPERYQSITNPQKPNIDYIYSCLDPSIKAVDAYSKLEAHSDEYLYFNTDHHWTVQGAYYAYQAFAETAGFEAIPYEDFEFKRKENFLGTLYAQTQDSKLRETGDYVDYPVITTPHRAYMYQRNQPYTPYASTVFADYATGGNSYSVFLHGDHPLMKIETDLNNGRKIMVVKESFGNAFAPFLINHYETVYVVDERYFQIGAIDYIKQEGINELIFVNNVFAANTSYRIQDIGKIMYQQFVPPVVEPAPEDSPSSEPTGEEETSSSQESASSEPESSSSREEDYDPYEDEDSE